LVGRRQDEARVVYFEFSSVVLEQVTKGISDLVGLAVPNNVWRNLKINQSVGWSQ